MLMCFCKTEFLNNLIVSSLKSKQFIKDLCKKRTSHAKKGSVIQKKDQLCKKGAKLCKKILTGIKVSYKS